ncbi:MAG: MFS transporter [Desulfitobacterium sp.]
MGNSIGNSRHWLVMIGACLIMSAVALGTTCLGFFVKPITTELGYSRGAFTLYVSLITLTSIFALPVFGKQIPKYGIKKLVIVGGIWCSLAFVGLSFAKSLLSFYIAGAFLGVMLFCITSMASIVLVNIWFVAKKGLVLGIVAACSGVSGAIFSMLLPNFIITYGWRNSYLLLAASMFILTVLPALFFITDAPQKVGLMPYGYDATQKIAGQSGGTAQTGVPYNKAIKSPQFYILYLGIALCGIILGVSSHLPANFMGNGLTPTQTGSLMSIMMMSMIVVKILEGVMNDKLGSITTTGIIATLAVVAFIIMPSASFGILSIAMVLYSFEAAFIGIVPPLMTGQIFGQRDYSGIWGIYATAGSVGMTIGTPLWGIIYDVTGSYRLGFYGAAVLAIVVFLLFFLGKKSASNLVFEPVEQKKSLAGL